MTLGRRSQWAVTIFAVLAVLFAIALMSASGPEAQAAPAQQAKVCTWKNIGNNRSNLFHVASASDTDKNTVYVYGGVNENLEPQNRVESIAVTDPADLKGTMSIVSAAGAKKLVGAAGAYRAKGDTDDSGVYWFGGNADPTSGQGSTNVQAYMTKSGTWGTVSATNDSEFKSRFFAAAAYDPVHDAIWVVGGTNSCKLGEVLQGQSCNATAMATQYLKFDDPNPGEMTWYTLGGGYQSIYGATLVYDEGNQQMVLFGGTKNISQAQSAVTVLDVSKADPASASWSTASDSGTAPSVYFHQAAYSPTDAMMYVYGGVKQNFMQSNESTNTNTYALDLSKWPNPTWDGLTPAGTPGGRVASAMGYVPLHNTFVVGLGREKFESGDPLPAQNTQKNSFALTCMDAPTPTDVPTQGPTDTPGPVPTGGATNTAEPPTAIPGDVCDIARSKVPTSVLNDAVANPGNYYGYDLACNPNLPVSIYNPLRRMLSISQPNKPFHPWYNSVEWKCGCP